MGGYRIRLQLNGWKDLKNVNDMQGYTKRNINGVKEIHEGDVRPEWNLTYGMRHSMSQFDWSRYWEDKIAWEIAEIIYIHPALYWAFPEEGKVTYEIYGLRAVPIGFDTSLLNEKKEFCRSRANMKFERLLHTDGGYRQRRNSKDGGL